MQVKANKNGVKLLAAVMVFAMAFAGIVVMADSSDAADVTYINGTVNADTYFGENTTVVVDKDLKIINGATLYIQNNCKFTVNEGVTITIDGAKTVEGVKDPVKATLSIENTALVNINGTISVGENGIFTTIVPAVTVEEDAEEDLETVTPTADAAVFLSGTLNAARGGTLDLDGGIVVKKTGSINVLSSAKISKICGDVFLNDGASIVLKGEVCKGADLDVIAYEIEDQNSTPKKVSSYTFVCIEDQTPESILSKISDITIKAQTTTYNAFQGADKYTLNVCDLSVGGTVQGGDILTFYDVADDGQYYLKKNSKEATDLIEDVPQITISELNVARNGAIENYDANIVVDGKLTLMKEIRVNEIVSDPAGKITLSGGVITVTGTIEMDNSCIDGVSGGYLKVIGGSVTITDVAGKDTVNFGIVFGATYYNNSTKVLTICDLEVAIAAADGNNVSEVTVSAGKESKYALANDITINDFIILNVDGVLEVAEANTLTVQNYGTVVGGKIVVNGKVVDNSVQLKIVDVGGIVECEVIKTINDGETQIFTTLKIALSDAASGDVINLVGNVDVSGKLTIPTGVTVDTDGKTVKVKVDGELVIDGVMDASKGTLLTVKSDSTTKKDGVVTVNNILLITNETFGDTFNVAGVYTDADISDLVGSKVVSIEVFVVNATEDDDGTVMGKVTATDIAPKAALAIAGELTANSITVTNGLTVDGKLVANSITLDGSSVEVSNNGTVTAEIDAAEGKVSLVAIKNVTITNVVDEEEGINKIVISGTPAIADEKTSSLKITSGAIYAEDLFTTGITKFEVSEGTTLIVTKSVTTKDLTITGNVDIEGTLTIAGNLTVLSNGQFTVKEDAQASANNIYLGIKAGDFTVNGSATVSGVVAVNANGKIYVAEGNTVDEKTIEGKGVVKYVVEGATWMTVYGTVTDTVDMGKAPVENADFVCWNDKDGEAITNVTFTNKEQTITAQVKYDIYSVSIIADNGIGTVAIDGVVLFKQSNMFIADDLVAGTHTISFELKNGYEGTVKMTVNGQAVSGYQFTLSGTAPADREVTINLSGTAPAEPTTPVTPTPTPSEKDDGMGITDYLLIVLVIMVVILAIVVIARMFRS